MFDFELQNALRLRREGKLAEAAHVYGEILRNDPKHFEALHALGIVRYQTGALEEAERLIGAAIALRPAAADALFNRGSLLARLGRFDDALSAFGNAIEAKPDYVEALTNRGVLLAQKGRFAEALADFTRVTGMRPMLAQGWRNRTAAEEALSRFSEALTSVERVIALESADAGAVLKRADILLQLNRAADAEAAYGAYLSRVPGDAPAWNRRGIANAELKRKDEALAAFGRAAELQPNDADFWNNRANALFEMKRYAEAAQDYQKALSLQPDLPYTEGYLLQCRVRCCDWQGLSSARERITAGIRAGKRVIDPLSHLAIAENSADQLACARLWAADLSRPAPLWRGERYTHDKIRIAYLSADFRLHPVAYLLAGVLEAHDRSRFEISAVAFTPPGDNPMRRRIEAACDAFHDVRDKTDTEAAGIIREREIDIAVDLMGFTDSQRSAILNFRPAPVQAQYLGYPSTMASASIDYILADATVIPESERRYYSESVVHLADCYLPGGGDRKIATPPSRAEAGLPRDGFVFASFNDAFKISPDVFDIWMRLLARIPASVLWLAAHNPAAVDNLKREAKARGIAPERILFARFLPSMADHLARLGLADLVLDTLPYNAHASASDALLAGVPLVTCSGETFAARVAASALKAARLPDLITHSLADYETLALHLAEDQGALRSLRTRLAAARAQLPFFDAARFARKLETAFTEMHARHMRGERPASFAAAAP